MTALMLAASGVVGMKLGQLLHSFGFVSEEFKNQLEALKSNSPVPFMKRDLFRLLEYYGLEDVRVFNKLGEASIKAVYRVERQGRSYALKVKKPFVDREAEDGLAILGSMMEGLEALGPAAEGAGFELPRWLVDFLHRTIHDELDFGEEVRSAKSLKAQMEKGTRLRDLWNLLRAMLAYEGGWTSLRAWKKILAGLRQGRAPGIWNIGVKSSYTAGELTGRGEDAIPGMILDDLVDAADYTKTAPEKRAGLESDLAPGFVVSLAKGFYHADLHEGNIMIEKEAEHQAWLLDTGAMGRITNRDLRSVALLLRALGERDAASVRKSLAVLYAGIQSPRADLDRVIGEAFDKANVIKGILHILKEVKGEPRYDFLQLIKAFTAAGFIMRHLSIIPEGTAAPAAAAPADEAPPVENPAGEAVAPTVRELVDRVISDRTPAGDKTAALRRLAETADGIRDRWSMTDEERELSRVTDAVLTEIIANDDYPDDLRGAAFRLFNGLIAKSALSEGRPNDTVYRAEYSPGLKRHSLALMQELIERDALSIQPGETDRLDYLDGLLTVYEMSGELKDREDSLEKEHVDRLREIALDERFNESIRSRAGRLLVQRLDKEYAGLKANEVIAGVLLGLWRSATPASLRVELAMLTAYQAANSDRLFGLGDFEDYMEARVASLVDGRAAGPEMGPLIKIVMRGMQYLNNYGSERYKEYVERFVLGNSAQTAARFSRIFELMTVDGRDAGERLSPLMTFAYKFVDYAASSLRHPGEWLPEMAPDQRAAILSPDGLGAALRRLEAVQAFALDKSDDNLSLQAWKTFRSLWNLAEESRDERLVTLVRESWKTQRDQALVVTKKSGSQDWSRTPGYMRLASEFAGSFEFMRMSSGISLSGLIQRPESRELVRDTAAQILRKVISDIEADPEMMSDSRTRGNVSSLITKLTALYLYTALYDQTSGTVAARVTPDASEAARLRDLFGRIFGLALNARLPVEFRSHLFLQHLDMEQIAWAPTVGNYFGGYQFEEARNHPYLAQNRDLFYAAAREAVLRAGLAPQLIEVSDLDTRNFYYGLVRYFLDRSDPALAGDANFTASVEAIRAVFESWKSRQANGGAGEQNTLALLDLAGKFIAARAPEASALGAEGKAPGKPKRQEEWTDAQWESAVAVAVARLRARAGDPGAARKTRDVVIEMAVEAQDDPSYDPSLRRVLTVSGFNSALRRIKRNSGIDLAAKYGIFQRARFTRWDSARWSRVIQDAVREETQAGRPPGTANVAEAIRRRYPRERGDFTAEKLRQLEYDKKKKPTAINLRALGVQLEQQALPWKKEELEAAILRAVENLDARRQIPAGATDKPSYGTREITDEINDLKLRAEPLLMGSLLRTADRYNLDLRQMRVRVASPGPRWSTETWISRIRRALDRIREMEVVEPATETVAYIMTGMMVEEVMQGRPIPEGFKEITAVKLNAFEDKHLPFENAGSLADLGVSKRDMAPPWSPDQWERAVDLAVGETAARGINEPNTRDIASIVSELSGTVPELGPARVISVRQLGQAVRAYGIDLSRHGVRVIRSVAGAVKMDEDRDDRASRHETVADPAALDPAALAADDDWFEYLLGFFSPEQQEMMKDFKAGKLRLFELESTPEGETASDRSLRLSRLAEWQKMKLILAYFLGNEMGLDTDKIAVLLSAGRRDAALDQPAADRGLTDQGRPTAASPKSGEAASLGMTTEDRAALGANFSGSRILGMLTGLEEGDMKRLIAVQKDAAGLEAEILRLAREGFEKIRAQMKADSAKVLELLAKSEDLVSAVMDASLEGKLRDAFGESASAAFLRDGDFADLARSIREAVLGEFALTLETGLEGAAGQVSSGAVSDFGTRLSDAMRALAEGSGEKFILAITNPRGAELEVVVKVLSRFSSLIERLEILQEKGGRFNRQSWPREQFPQVSVQLFRQARLSEAVAEIQKRALGKNPLFALTEDSGLSRMLKDFNAILAEIGRLPDEQGQLREMAYGASVLLLFRLADLASRDPARWRALRQDASGTALKNFIAEDSSLSFLADRGFGLDPNGSITLNLGAFVESLTRAAEERQAVEVAA
jgi:hypothetical protein